MNVSEGIKSVGLAFALLIAVLAIALIFMLGVILFHGSMWLTNEVYPYVMKMLLYTFEVHLIAILPLSFIKKARRVLEIPLLAIVLVYGLALGTQSILTTYTHWGGLGVFIGLFMGGIGIIPAGIASSALNGSWFEAGLIVAFTVLFGAAIAHQDWIE
jgi:hypothetical protein